MATRAGTRSSLPLVAMLGLMMVVGANCRPGGTIVPPMTVRDRLLSEAQENYTYGPERAAVPVSDSAFGGTGGMLPILTIATARRTDSTGRARLNRFIARVTSNGPYPPMGLDSGANYIWRDSVSADSNGIRTLVVPRRSPAMTWIRRGYGMYLHIPTPEPRLIHNSHAYSGCDVWCPMSHCEWRQRLRFFVDDDAGTIRIGGPRMP
jgi:hypothetical protein